MSLPRPTSSSRSLPVLKAVLYVLAGFTMLVGLVGAISLMTGASMIANNLLLPLTVLGAAVAYNMLAPMLTGALVNLGLAVLILSLVFSALLYAAGRLVGHISNLEARLSTLEMRGSG